MNVEEQCTENATQHLQPHPLLRVMTTGCHEVKPDAVHKERKRSARAPQRGGGSACNRRVSGEDAAQAQTPQRYQQTKAGREKGELGRVALCQSMTASRSGPLAGQSEGSRVTSPLNPNQICHPHWYQGRAGRREGRRKMRIHVVGGGRCCGSGCSSAWWDVGCRPSFRVGQTGHAWLRCTGVELRGGQGSGEA